MSKEIVKVWFFSSSSSSRQYQTLLYFDETISCDCPGWTKRVDSFGRRSCKHTRLVEADLADGQCEKLQVMPGPVVRTAEEAAEFTKRFKQQSTRPAETATVRAFNFDE